MAGMNTTTGRALDGLPHIRQSIKDIITTRIGTRLMRRDYGSLVPELLDHPMNAGTRLRLSAATVMAIMRWEPRVRLTSVSFEVEMDGRVVLDLSGVRTDGPRSGEQISLTTTI